jgi:hypothetical protein
MNDEGGMMNRVRFTHQRFGAQNQRASAFHKPYSGFHLYATFSRNAGVPACQCKANLVAKMAALP